MRNVLLQIRFKCLAFAQKCRQNAGNAISETEISKIFGGGLAPGAPSWTRLTARTCTPPGAAYSSFGPGGKSACYASVNNEYTYRDFLKMPYAKVYVIFA